MAAWRAHPVAAGAALGIDALAGAWAIGRADDDVRGLVAALAAAALLAAVLALVTRRFGLVVCGAIGLGASFMVSQAVHAVAVGAAAGFGVVVFLAAELAASAILVGPTVTLDEAAQRRRRVEIALAGAGAVAVTALLAAAQRLVHGGGFALFTAACVAAFALIGLFVWLGRGPRDGAHEERL